MLRDGEVGKVVVGASHAGRRESRLEERRVGLPGAGHGLCVAADRAWHGAAVSVDGQAADAGRPRRVRRLRCRRLP